MDKTLRNVLIVSTLVSTFSVAYYLVLKPVRIQKTEFDACFEKCVQLKGNEQNCVITCGRNYSVD